MEVTPTEEYEEVTVGDCELVVLENDLELAESDFVSEMLFVVAVPEELLLALLVRLLVFVVAVPLLLRIARRLDVVLRLLDVVVLEKLKAKDVSQKPPVHLTTMQIPLLSRSAYITTAKKAHIRNINLENILKTL